jgi:hypothetical protein
VLAVRDSRAALGALPTLDTLTILAVLGQFFVLAGNCDHGELAFSGGFRYDPFIRTGSGESLVLFSRDLALQG